MPGLLMHGAAPGAAVRWHVLVDWVQTDPLALVAAAMEVAAVAGYLVAVRRLRSRGRRWPVACTASFVAGVCAVWVAVGSGLAAYDELSVNLHVVQHLLLMMVAPPLVALGKPVTLVSQAADRRLQVRLLALARSRPLEVLTHPAVGAVVYYGTMVGYFLTPLYSYSVRHQAFHDATHLVFLTVGYLYWQPMVGGDPNRRRLSHPARVLAIMLGSTVEAFLGILLGVWPRALSPINTLADTHAAGRTFLFWGMLLSGTWIAVILVQWLLLARRQAPQAERRAELEAAARRERFLALGGETLPEGWTVPWWRLAEMEAAARPLTGGPPVARPPGAGPRPGGRRPLAGPPVP